MDKTPQYVIVNSGQKKKLVTTKPKAMQIVNKEDEWPPALREYVAHAFANVLPNKKALLETQLKTIIAQAERTDMMDMIDWSERDLPSACLDTKNPNASDLFHKKEKSITSRLGNIELTAAEVKRRELRAMRFQTDIPTKARATPKVPTPTITTKTTNDTKSITPISWDTMVLPSSVNAVKKKKPYSLIQWDMVASPETAATEIVGTSTALEKPYFRLTSAADPATVRPLNILKKAFKMLRTKWREEGNYSYICEQFKSMRQDLTVQRIRNEFTVRVYETHARIALEKGDIGEYNQCQTQLKYLYEQNIPGCVDEFLAYRILYMLFSRNRSDINAIMEEMCDVGLENHAACVQHALMIRSALAKGNYHKFFRLYEDAPNMGGYLIDQFVGRVRIEALIVICKSFKMGVPMSFVAKELAFDNIKQLVKFLKGHGVKQLASKSKDGTFDTRSALLTLVRQSKSYNKVDIKGQI